MVTRTSTTRTTRSLREQSADTQVAGICHTPILFEDVVQAYFDCRKSKRNKLTSLEFEINLERNLTKLFEELKNGTYEIGQSICFAITHPKPREVWAAAFRDRIVHHLVYNKISPEIEKRFIADSCACIKQRGTAYGAIRLEHKVRSITQNWKINAFYLKVDLANFFVALDKRVLETLITRHLQGSAWLPLTLKILWHNPRENFALRCPAYLLNKVPAHKRLANQPSHLGLPIGNLSSQFFANIFLNELDQFVKHQLKAVHYIRYVDDSVILHTNPKQLTEFKNEIQNFLVTNLNASLNPKKTIIKPIERGIDFVGQVIKTHHRVTRKKSVNCATQRILSIDSQDLMKSANSYFGLLRQASHSFQDRKKLTKALFQRGKAVNKQLTKTYKS